MSEVAIPPALAKRALLACLAAAVLSRVAAAIVVGGPAFRFVDESLYTAAAGRLTSGEGLTGRALEMPGYPAFLAALGLVLPGGLVGLRVAQAIVAAAGVPLCYRLGSCLGGTGAGLAAAALYALDPLLVVSAGLLYPESVAAVLVLGAVLAAWRGVRDNRLPVTAAAGLLLGVTTLFRPVALAFLPPMVGWALAGGRHPGRRGIGHAAVLIGAWAVLITPWMAASHRATGYLLPTSTAVRNVAGASLDTARQGVVGGLAGRLKEDPAGFLGRTAREFGHFWELVPTRLATDDPERRARLAQRFPEVSGQPLVQRGMRDLLSAASFGAELVLALVGVVVALRRSRRESLWLLAMILGFGLGYALFFGKTRYRIPILPLLFAFAGLGAAVSLDRLRRRRPL